MPDTFYHFVNQLTFRRPKLSRLSAFASFYPALREHIEASHKQFTTTIVLVRDTFVVQQMTDTRAQKYLCTEIDHLTEFADACSELCVRYAYNTLITGKTTFAQFLTRLDTLLASHTFLQQRMDDWMNKPLLKSITVVLHNLVHPSTGILHSSIARIFGNNVERVIRNTENALGTMHTYATFDDCIKHIFTTKHTMFSAPLLSYARKMIRTSIGEQAWVERETYYQLVRSVLLIPKELMECLVVEISAQLRVDNELFECFPHHYSPSSNLSTFQTDASNRLHTRKSTTHSVTNNRPSKRKGLFSRLFDKSHKTPKSIPTVDQQPPTQQIGGGNLTPYKSALYPFSNTFSANKALDVLNGFFKEKDKDTPTPTPTTPSTPAPTPTTPSTPAPTPTTPSTPAPTPTPTTPSTPAPTPTTPTTPIPTPAPAKSTPSPRLSRRSTRKSASNRRKSYIQPDNITPESLQRAWQHQREAETNTREVMQKLSVSNIATDAKQSWWKRMKSRMYTFTHKKENIEFYGLTVLQFTPLQLLCAYLTPLHLHCEGWSDQLTLVAMMYHMQTLDLLPSLTSIGSGSLATNESFCTHVKDLPIASTLSSATKSLLTNRQSKCTTRSTQLHDDYCSTVSSLRKEMYPVTTLLETKGCAKPLSSSGGRQRRARPLRRSRRSRNKFIK